MSTGTDEISTSGSARIGWFGSDENILRKPLKI